MTESQRVETNAERTAAGVIAEWFATNPLFQRRMLDALSTQIGLEIAADAPRVESHPTVWSGKDGRDLTLRAHVGDSDIAFLVTVSGGFDPLFAARAREAVDQAREGSEAAIVFSALVCAHPPPESDDDGARYDAAIPFADIRAMLEPEEPPADAELRARHAFQRHAFAEAEQALLEGWTPHFESRGFHLDYLAFLEATAPGLPVASAKVVAEVGAPAEIAFDADALPFWDFMGAPRLSHHIRLGKIAIAIDGWGHRIDALGAIMEPALAKTGYTIATTPETKPGDNPGLLILADAPRLDPDAPFIQQVPAARDCAHAALAMKKWWGNRRAAARYWAELADPDRAMGDEGYVRRGVKLR